MSVYRCKMCGGDLSVVEGASYCTCEFCGTKQTIPTVIDEGLQNLFNRANLLRMKSEFDKAAEIYEKILQQSSTESEAYWGLILCKYGIEYVEDPSTNKRIPTCHRASYDAVTVDEDYKNALKYSDTVQRGIYEEQAREIDQLQRGILDIVHKEKPYDVFICYKETDEAGKRTPDSVIANDIYHQLTMEGFKVFYAAITLEDKLGTEYEPYIFSALNTAKVMLAIGTKPEYFNAVWVKNEWSRFLKIMKNDRTRLLIPCYRDMDPYELPEEFAHLQAQDMSKIGFINDIVRGIKKVIERDSVQPKEQNKTVVQAVASGTTVNAQVKRGNMALEDHDWNKADEFFEEALNLDPECAEAYLGKLLARDQQPSFDAWLALQNEKNNNASSERLEACPIDKKHIEQSIRRYKLKGYLEPETIWREYEFDRIYYSSLSTRKSQKAKQQTDLSSNRMLTRARQYAKGCIKQQIEDGLAEVYQVLDERINAAQKQDETSIAKITEAYENHIAETDKKIEQMNAEAMNHLEQRYQDVVACMNAARDVQDYREVIFSLSELDSYKDSEELISRCNNTIYRLEEEKRQEEERKVTVRKQEAEQHVKKQKKTLAVIGALIALCVVCIVVVTQVVIPNQKNNKAVALLNSGDYESAYALLEEIGKSDAIAANKYDRAVALIDSGDYEEACILLKDLDYKDSVDKLKTVVPLVQNVLLSKAQVGSYVYYGAYEQDNNASNGKENIEWLVLDVEDNQALIISKYVLDYLPYNEKQEDTMWKTCSLRKWLNGTFLNDAFSTEEQKIILPKQTEENAKDNVFLLETSETTRFFSSNDMRKCQGTDYYKAQYFKEEAKVDNFDYCSWWLRSWRMSDRAATVWRSGEVESNSMTGVHLFQGVRPALWIKLN